MRHALMDELGQRPRSELQVILGVEDGDCNDLSVPRTYHRVGAEPLLLSELAADLARCGVVRGAACLVQSPDVHVGKHALASYRLQEAGAGGVAYIGTGSARAWPWPSSPGPQEDMEKHVGVQSDRRHPAGGRHPGDCAERVATAGGRPCPLWNQRLRGWGPPPRLV